MNLIVLIGCHCRSLREIKISPGITEFDCSILTLKELLLCLACPTTLLGLSGNESEFDLVVQRGGARDDVPYDDIC